MARRKEVFQSKVLQKLYPVPPSLERDPSPPGIVDTLAKKTCVKRKAPKQDPTTGDEAKTQSAVNPGRRMYTVLPPPADYKTDSEKSITPLLLENINSAEDPAGDSAHDSNEEDKEEEQSRKRRRRKKTKTHRQDSERRDVAAPIGESSAGQSVAAVDEGGERISRNKKRKLKKKRCKEKLLSMGLMPRAAALEFTYRKDGEEEEERGREAEEPDNERRAAEVSDFLRTTMEIYTSDSLMRADKRLPLSGTLDDLLSSIDSGRKPSSVLKQLYSLKAFVQQRKTDELEKALEELHNASTMSPEEATAVVSLFQYWITDILPVRRDTTTTTTGLSTSHL